MTQEAKSVTINIAKDFSFTPGFRNRQQGSFSGEEFREKFLEKNIEDDSIKKIIVDFDGTAGFATSFLEEAFGGLVRKYGYENVCSKLEFVSIEDDVILRDVEQYMKEADTDLKQKAK